MKLIEALAYTFEAMGQEISDAGIRLMAKDLETYPLQDVCASLSRCRKELRKLCLADILDRMPNAHPGPEEAWSICYPALTDERVTIVYTEQMAKALGAAQSLADDPVAARMAFKEVYQREVAKAREQADPPRWTPSLGWSAEDREAALIEAHQQGRLSQQQVIALLPHKPERQEWLEQKFPALVALRW